MPDLGKYAVEVISAYAVSLGLLGLLIWLSLRRARRTEAALREIETRMEGRG